MDGTDGELKGREAVLAAERMMVHQKELDLKKKDKVYIKGDILTDQQEFKWRVKSVHTKSLVITPVL